MSEGTRDDVTVPSMEQAILTALTPSLQPTGEHRVLPDGYCPDCCGAPCIREWLPAARLQEAHPDQESAPE